MSGATRPHPPAAHTVATLPGGLLLPSHGASSLLPLQVVKRVLAQTSSGSFCGNDGFMHLTLDSLPFGGVGR